MRNYPHNSPQAAARIVALALLADGSLCKREIDVLDRLDAQGQIGLGRSELHGVVHEFCEDLMCSMQLTWEDACRVDEHTLRALLAEISDPALRRLVLQLCRQVIEVDAHVSEGEALLLSSASAQWGLPHAPFAPHQH